MNRLMKVLVGIALAAAGVLPAFRAAAADVVPAPGGSSYKDPIIWFGVIVLVLVGLSMFILYRIHRTKHAGR